MNKLKISFHGHDLCGLKWEINDNIANVIILEGMEEHSSRYEGFAEYLNQKGYNVYCVDAFGQGENVSDDLSNIGIWPEDGFSIFVDIIHDFAVSLKSDSKPLYIFSHSMGSFMGQYFIQYYPGVADKIVLCGAGIKSGALVAGNLIAKMVTNNKTKHKKATTLNKLMFGNFNNKIKSPRTPYDWLSYNTKNVDDYIADPLCGFGPNNQFCLEFIKGMRKLNNKKALKKLDNDLNMFIITGIEDPVTAYSKYTYQLEKFYKKCGVKDVSIKIYPHARHEILNEDIKETVYEDIYNFFNK